MAGAGVESGPATFRRAVLPSEFRENLSPC